MTETATTTLPAPRPLGWILIAPLAGLALAVPHGAAAQTLTGFTAGDLVVSVYGKGAAGDTTTYTDNQASPITLQEFSLTGAVVATPVGQLVLPQTTVGSNSVISGEYGSSSEGSLQLSGDGQSLVIAGYGISAPTFNSGTVAQYGTTALAQTTSIQGGQYTAVPRVIADITANGSVDTSTALYGVFNGNNPRSVATVNGSSFYISGQGQSGDTTEGLFLAQDGASSATAINTASDTRTVEIANGKLYTSLDTKVGAGQYANISSYGSTVPTSPTAPTPLTGISSGSGSSPYPGKVSVAGGKGNSINMSSATGIYLSPENYFFVGTNVVYIADSGNPKAGGPGDGGLQKWMLIGSTWTLEYTLSAGLGLVADTTASPPGGTTGLIGLTGEVVGGNVELFATNSTLGDTNQTYLYGITDSLAATTAAAGESFTTLLTAAPDTNIRGVAFAPQAAAVPEPASLAVLASGLLGLLGLRRRRG